MYWSMGELYDVQWFAGRGKFHLILFESIMDILSFLSLSLVYGQEARCDAFPK